jgi:hypothetical protein
VPQTKTIITKELGIETYSGGKLPRTLSRVTYNVENGVVSGSGPGKSAIIDIYTPINQGQVQGVKPEDLFTKPVTRISPVGVRLTIDTYWRRVARRNEDGKFESTPYTEEVDGLQDNIDGYNTNSQRKENGEVVPNQLINVTRVANKAVTAEEKVDINNNTKNQTLLGQRNLNADAQDVKDAVDNPLDIDDDFKIASKTFRTKYGDYCYPSDMRNNKQDRIRFSMKSSEGSNIKTSLKESSIKRRTGTPITGSVTLPIQNGIVDRNAVDWNPGSLNSISGLAVGSALELMDSDNTKELGSNIEEIYKRIKSQLRADKSTYSDALKLYLAQEAVGVQGVLSRATGAIINPNLELLFNAPTLRPFTFTFKMSPRSAPEAAQVKQIIRFFKQGMAVKKAESNVFLKAPNIFDIQYQTHNGTTIVQHPSLNRIKECALTACDVEYTPDGTYMTFDDASRTMTSYQMTLSFTELDPIYEDDYNTKDIKNPITDLEVGY